MPPVVRWRGLVVLAALPLTLLACSGRSGSAASAPTQSTVSASTGAASPSDTTDGPAPVGSTTPGGSTTTKGVPSLSGVTITRTGGLAGVQQAIAVASDGSWTYTDKRSGNTRQGKLTTAQRQDLARLLADPALAAEGRRATTGGSCADGFIYTITFGEESMRYEQCGAAGQRPLTNQLLALLQNATPL